MIKTVVADSLYIPNLRPKRNLNWGKCYIFHIMINQKS